MTTPAREPDWDLPVLLPPQPRRATFHPRSWTTLTRLRLSALAAIMLGAVIVANIAYATGELRDVQRLTAQQLGPRVIATAELHGRFSAMDLHLASALLVGREPVAGGRAEALRLFGVARGQASAEIDRIAAVSADVPAARVELRAILDGLSRYDALTGQITLLSEKPVHPLGRPPLPVLERHRQATDLMHTQLLPAVQRLKESGERSMDRAHNDGAAAVTVAQGWAVLAVLALIAVLLGLQLLLARRHRRRLNPLIALATVAALSLTVAGYRMLGADAERLQHARTDALHSVLALSTARAIALDAQGDLARSIMDPDRRAGYRSDYLDKSLQVLAVPDATVDSYPDGLEDRTLVPRYEPLGSESDGAFGMALRNVTFAGERAMAEAALARMRDYHYQNRTVRKTEEAGDLRTVVPSVVAGSQMGSQHAFALYDAELAELTRLNRRHYDRALAEGDREPGAPIAAGILVIGLLLAGIGPRLAEYR